MQFPHVPGPIFFKHRLTLNQYIWIFYGRISETINELLMFFRAPSMICNFHTFFFKHLLTLNFNIFGNYAHVPPFFLPRSMRGRIFGTMPSGSTVADQLARSAGAHGALRNLAHGDSLTKNLGRA